ncbi:bacillithiol biosynthesis deacetylase BshB1 [Paenibacillus lutrae]|uniref:Bacillithiol biosynthesis deacetylase BshB1 n=1 Tax=Paenibacillus lutrae TaxID=2078573 RepID=A0A7X3JZG5_9BACL|nr:bacillithiol biosynthesis deacetylase BshB1 [Paenibacillus lutrae]MVP00010.1 bacillithiol biosynthesis deacetylase BshB1 [Paenibacillus lutrae]
METVDILVFGAHADDAEIGMSGTILKHTRAGITVGLCDLTRSEMSSNGTVDNRLVEADKAADVLGVSLRSNLGLPDRGLSATSKDQIDAVTQEIRLRKPRIVFAPYWEDRHPDHIACSRIVQEAVFNAKLRRYLPDTEAVQVESLYFYFINDTADPDLVVDISEVYAGKIHALEAYKSQFTAPEIGKDIVATPINQNYLQRVEARDALLGQKRMYTYAEGFMSKLPYSVDYFLPKKGNEI